MKLVHSLIDQAVDHLREGTGKDTISGGGNRGRIKLYAWAEVESKRADSVYHGWSILPLRPNP